MSVIIKDPRDGKIKMYIKGADNIIKQRLAKGRNAQPFLENINYKLDDFAKEGLRTLCIAMREISEDELKHLDQQIEEVMNQEGRDEKIFNIISEYERNLFLIGCTAIEDKLQQNVPETIRDFMKANIKVWVLTGDKLETAENVAKSCNLFEREMRIIHLDKKNLSELEKSIEEAKEIQQLCLQTKQKKGLLIDGESLTLIFSNQRLIEQLLFLSSNSESVVCCRVTPKQKAQVVRLIRKKLKKLTLSIGDGANDVNMIQEANIGIGIYGNEGMRAVQASDFAIGEFQCLWRLLFVHGRWNYMRISEMILFFFYKNLIFTIPQVYFTIFCCFSAQSVFDDWYISFYNLFFTALPIISRAVFDQDYIHTELKQVDQREDGTYKFKFVDNPYLRDNVPRSYYKGRLGIIFTPLNFALWVAESILVSLFLFIINYFIFYKHHLNDDGHNSDFRGLSIVMFSSIVLIVDFKMSIHTKYWWWFNWVSIVPLSIGIYFLYFIISSYLPIGNVQKTSIFLLTTVQLYASILLCSLTIFAINLVQNLLENLIKKDFIYFLACFAKAAFKYGSESLKARNNQVNPLYVQSNGQVNFSKINKLEFSYVNPNQIEDSQQNASSRIPSSSRSFQKKTKNYDDQIQYQEQQQQQLDNNQIIYSQIEESEDFMVNMNQEKSK